MNVSASSSSLQRSFIYRKWLLPTVWFSAGSCSPPVGRPTGQVPSHHERKVTFHKYCVPSESPQQHAPFGLESVLLKPSRNRQYTVAIHASVFYACLLSYKLAPFGTVQTLASFRRCYQSVLSRPRYSRSLSLSLFFFFFFFPFFF
jgi:hypothetical protein